MKYHHVFVWDNESSVEGLLENIIKYPRDTHVYDAGCEYDLGKIAHTGAREWYDDSGFMEKLTLVKKIISQYPDIHNRIILHLGTLEEINFNCRDTRYEEIYPIFGKIHFNWLALAWRSMSSAHKPKIHMDLTEYQNKPPEYLFSCAQHKPHSHRVSLMLALIETGLIDSGLATWCASSNAWAQFREHLINEIKAGVDNHLNLIFENFLKIHPDHWASYKSVGRNIIGDTMTHYDKCLFDIVSESTMAPLIYSEKTWRPIVWGKPFTIVGHPEINTKLEALGFDCFTDIFDVNVSYDAYDMNRYNPERHSEIKRQISGLCDIDPDSWADLKQKLRPRCEHNQAMLIKHLFDDNLVPEFMLDSQGGSVNSALVKEVRTYIKQHDYFKRFCPNV